MTNWTFKTKYWALPVNDAGHAVEMLIYPVDHFTEGECEDYGVKYDPNKNFSIHVQWADGEIVILALADTLEEAQGLADGLLEDIRTSVRNDTQKGA